MKAIYYLTDQPVLLREAGGIPWDYVTGNVIVCTRTEGGEGDEDEE